MLIPALLVVAAYLLGSISFAVVFSRAYGLPDPHGYGSGNPGATNVLRTGHKAAALLTLAGDGLKGFVAVYAAQHLAPPGTEEWTVAAAALAVFLGHVYPVWHRFAGGKGVSAAAGIVFALHWPLGAALMVVWVTMAFGFKISSLAALTTAVLMPLGMFYVFGPTIATSMTVVIAVLLFWRHRANIAGLVAGRERRIGN